MASKLAFSLGLDIPDKQSLPLVVVSGSALVVVATYGIKWLIDKLIATQKRQQNKNRRDKKRKECQQSIQNLAQKLNQLGDSAKRLEPITKLPLKELLVKLKSGVYSAQDVLTAYQIKALKAHKVTNCLIEVFPEAQKWAEEVDAGDKQGLLAGVPISIKDDVGIKGYDSSLGCVAYLDKPSKDDAVLLKILKKHGAIPFVKTNPPQLCLSYDPGNPIFGTVRNPHNLERGPGGSSSGEGALVASGGSILGIGMDIAGSIRSPCHFSGLTGFKASRPRISIKGCIPDYMMRYGRAPPTWGPLARDVESVVLVLKAFWDGTMHELDPTTPPLLFDNQEYEDTRKLKIGYYRDNGFPTAVPTCQRAVEMAVNHLRSKGHQLVEWMPPQIEHGCHLLLKGLASDGGEDIRRKTANDLIDETIGPVTDGMLQSYCRKWLTSTIGRFYNAKAAEAARDNMGARNGMEYWEFVKEIQDYTDLFNEAWQSAGLDAVICPPFPMPASPLGYHKTNIESGSYLMIYNIVDYPAGIVRMTKVTQKDLQDMRHYPVKDDLHARIKKSMDGAEGMPVGVQVVTLRWKDELCLRVMKEIEPASDLPPVGQ